MREIYRDKKWEQLQSLLSDSNEGLLGVMRNIVSSENEAEIMREKSINILRKAFQPLFDAEFYSTTGTEVDIVIHFFLSYSKVILERFNSTHNSHQIKIKSARLSYKVNTEPVEEIRLLMMKLLSDILTYLQEQRQSSNPSNFSLKKSFELSDAFNSICQILPLQHALLDSYPELKRESCSVLKKLCCIAPTSVIRNNLDSLVQPLTFSPSMEGSDVGIKACLLQHRHSKTRVSAVEAAHAIVMSQLSQYTCENFDAVGNTPLDYKALNAIRSILETRILPSWKQCILDRSSLVRKSIIESLGNVSLAVVRLHNMVEREDAAWKDILSPFFWQLLFGSLADEASDNRILAKKTLAAVALDSSWFGLNNDQLNGLALHVLPIILPLDLEDAKNWSAPRRLQAIKSIDATFNAILVVDYSLVHPTPVDLSQKYINSLPLNDLITMICYLIEDEEALITQAAASCAETLGKHPVIGSTVAIRLISRLRGDFVVWKDVDSSIPTLLSMLNHVIHSNGYAGSQHWVENLLPDLSAVLSGSKILQKFADNASMMQLTNVCETILEVTCYNLSPSSVSKSIDCGTQTLRSDPLVCILRCCVQILGCPDAFGLSSRSMAIIDHLSAAHQREGEYAETLWNNVFRALLNTLLTENYDAAIEESNIEDRQSMTYGFWDTRYPRFAAFEAFLLHCDRDSLENNFDLVAPIFSQELAPPTHESSCKENTTGTHVMNLNRKLSFMALLQSVCSKISFDTIQLRSLTSNLVENVIAPSLVWQAGGQASALRKVSIACLYTLLHGGEVAAQLNHASLFKIFPLLKSNLVDDEASIRHLACNCVKILIKDSHVILELDYIDQAYAELVKALDDSNESIRLAACEALLEFLKRITVSMCNDDGIQSVLTYVVEHVMVHMDDSSNYQLQLKCLEVLTVALDIDPSVVVGCIKEFPTLQSKSKSLFEEITRRVSEKISIGMV